MPWLIVRDKANVLPWPLHSHSWCCMLIMTEFIWALEAYSLLTAFFDCTSSLARILATSAWPRLAASLTDFLTFSSSVLMAGGGEGRDIYKDGKGGREQEVDKQEEERDRGRRESGNIYKVDESTSYQPQLPQTLDVYSTIMNVCRFSWHHRGF